MAGSQESDPMLQEAHFITVGANASLRYSPDGGEDVVRSPEYRPVSKLWRAGGSLEARPSAAHEGAKLKEVVFGPGVQLPGPDRPGEVQVATISELVTQMDIDDTGRAMGTSSASDVEDPIAVDDAGADDDADVDEYAAYAPGGGLGAASVDPCDALFRGIPPPVLLDPDPTPQHQATRGRRAATGPTRSSTRLAMRPSSVPVAHRAQRKLMRELDFINGHTPAQTRL